MKSILRRFSSVIAIVAASFVLFTATVAVAFDKPPPINNVTAILMANYATPIDTSSIFHRDATGTTIELLKSNVSLTPNVVKLYGQVPEVTARSGPEKALPTAIDSMHPARKVAEATDAHTVYSWIPVPAKEPLEVSRSGSQNC